MGDYLKELFVDPGITSGISIKQEPQIGDTYSMSQSASVPIPPKRDINDYRNFDFDYAASPIYSDIQLSGQNQGPILHEGSHTWGLSPGLNKLINTDESFKSEPFTMDQDDIFQVDEADLIQGPTLAELNANDDNLLGDWNFDDLILPEDATYSLLEKTSLVQMRTNHLNNNIFSCPPQNPFHRDVDLSSSVPSGSFDYQKYKAPTSALSPGSHNSSNSSIFQSSSPLNVPSIPAKHSTLQELLVKNENETSLGQSYPDKNTSLPIHSHHSAKFPRNTLSGLSSSAPTHLGLEQIWQRREPRKHLLSTSSLVEAGSTSSLSTGGLLSPELPDFSFDEESDEDSDAHYEDFSSDNDSDDDEDRSTKGSSKKERFFWQYNVQAKGPKGQRLVLKSKMEDPHRLNEVTDPVFSPDCSIRGIKHSGKARKGDGNDLTPNPKKLHNIGRELEKLSKYINDMTPVSELPFNVRSTSRKEKNKLASRACRLKKKAQHEANKIKLSGLEIEHKRLLSGIHQVKQILLAKLSEQSSNRQEELTQNLEKIIKNSTKMKMAGHTTEYVNKVLDKFREGSNIHSSTVRYSEDM